MRDLEVQVLDYQGTSCIIYSTQDKNHQYWKQTTGPSHIQQGNGILLNEHSADTKSTKLKEIH